MKRAAVGIVLLAVGATIPLIIRRVRGRSPSASAGATTRGKSTYPSTDQQAKALAVHA
jgi:hypothetical protein